MKNWFSLVSYDTDIKLSLFFGSLMIFLVILTNSYTDTFKHGGRAVVMKATAYS